MAVEADLESACERLAGGGAGSASSAAPARSGRVEGGSHGGGAGCSAGEHSSLWPAVGCHVFPTTIDVYGSSPRPEGIFRDPHSLPIRPTARGSLPAWIRARTAGSPVGRSLGITPYGERGNSLARPGPEPCNNRRLRPGFQRNPLANGTRYGHCRDPCARWFARPRRRVRDGLP